MSELKRSQARPDDSDGGKRQDLTLASERAKRSSELGQRVSTAVCTRNYQK
jgi:hypothetical protein